ncbi:MAG: DUF4397 domain-containing protein, partial [Candidatus Kapaibacterium sp.]
ACSPADPFVPTKKSDSVSFYKGSGAFLRVINAAAGAPAVDVLIDTAKFFAAPQGYLTFSSTGNDAKYYPVDSLAGKISFKSGGTTLASQSVAFARNGYYTAYFYGTAADYHVLVTTDTVTDKPTGSRYRVVHLSPNTPTLSVHQDKRTNPPVVTNLKYGTASSYVTSKAYGIGSGTGLWVTDDLDSLVMAAPPPYIPLPSGSVWTIVLTGTAKPTGDDQFTLFSAFPENGKNDAGLYGSTPFRVNFGAIRAVNLLPSGTNDAVDVTFLDSADANSAPGEYFRKSLFQAPVLSVFNIDEIQKYVPTRPYFLLSTFTKTWWPYRIELDLGGDIIQSRPQPVIVPKQAFVNDPGKRFTIVAYGPYDKTNPNISKSARLIDNVTAPAGGGTRVRFFHGGYRDSLTGHQLKLLLNGTPGPLMSYGQAPGANMSFDAPSGTVTASVVDETGKSILPENESLTLDAGKIYTIFLSHGKYGDTTKLNAVPDDFHVGQ